MKDIVSILLTTSCLAIAGLGIYLFSYNSHENQDVTQKGGKKKSPSIKKQSDLENTKDNDCDDYDDYDDYDNNNINYTDNDKNTDYNYNPKTKTKNNKTKKYTNKLSSSKKRYY